MNLIEKAILKIIQRKVSHWFEMERSLANACNDYYGAIEGSPEKTWPDPHKIPSGGEIPFNIKNFGSSRKCVPFIRSHPINS